MAKELSFWRIHSDFLGYGPLHRFRQDAEEEMAEMIQEDPDDIVRIEELRMSAEAYDRLPEHEGY